MYKTRDAKSFDRIWSRIETIHSEERLKIERRKSIRACTIDYGIRKSGSDLPSGLVACSRAATYSIQEWDAARGQWVMRGEGRPSVNEAKEGEGVEKTHALDIERPGFLVEKS